jgi:acyl-CoA synthetase (NDP forming)
MLSAVADPIPRILDAAREAGRSTLLETEGFGILRALGIRVPEQRVVRGAAGVAEVDLEGLPGDRVVVKVLSADIPHRSDVGGVRIVAKERAGVAAAVAEMERRFVDRDVAGYALDEFVPHDPSFGGELLLGMRHTEDFGVVVTLGPGGVYAEHLASHLRVGSDVAILSPAVPPAGGVAGVLRRAAVVPAVTGEVRGQTPRLGLEELSALVDRFLSFAGANPWIAELDINPLVLTDSGPVALDVLLRVRAPDEPAPLERPVWKIGRLLAPRSAAIVGVSEKLNVGHIILNNMIRSGFDRERLWVVKPGRDRIEGCPCVPDLGALPYPVDLFVIAVDAAQVPGVVREIVDTRAAESVIVIPGGLGERSGTSGLVERMQSSLFAARASDWQGPVINGGNCLGVRSRPGRYDTMFIPAHKLPLPTGATTPLAILSQSGAFAVAALSKLPELDPRYVVAFGNQHDLTIGDYLTYLRNDPDIHVFACYVEGFRPLDGARWLQAAAEIVESGRTVLLYRAGRTRAGAQASASHTASIAGDYAVARVLATGAGAVNVESLADFADLTRLFCLLDGKRVRGLRLGALSNAGFECVAMADSLGSFRLPAFTAQTTATLEALFAARRLTGIVEVHNPADVTPILDDEGYEQAVRAVLEDEHVDAGIIGCVPLSGAIDTLAAGEGHAEDVNRASSVAHRLARLKDEISKPWVAVVDGGPLYDPMAAVLAAHGVPVFRTADRALRMFEVFCRSRLEARAG